MLKGDMFIISNEQQILLKQYPYIHSSTEVLDGRLCYPGGFTVHHFIPPNGNNNINCTSLNISNKFNLLRQTVK